jgi:hypothetical protein
MVLGPGPYLQVPIAPGQAASYYAVRFDKEGRPEGPLTRQHLIDALAVGGTTDVYVFCHGWNNDWKTALNHYRDFMATYRKLRDDHSLAFNRDYRPVLVGIHWPSTALVMPWEKGPKFAGDEGDQEADAVDLSLLNEVATRVDPDQLPRFYELVERLSLDEEEGTELLTIVSRIFADGDPDVEGDPGRDVDEMLVAWAKLEARLAPPPLPPSAEDFGAVGSGVTAAPEAAAFLGKLNPRNLMRGLTVYEMKDRAGIVGSVGVGPLLRDMLNATARKEDTAELNSAAEEVTRFHLIGHSYGARVLLTAVARPSGGSLPRPVDSLLLLQPAVNHLCFADRLPSGKPGGFRDALVMVKQPILSTFSSRDFALHDAFHLALRRGKDLGEIEIAGDEPPNQYAALGGYGPRGIDRWKEVDVKDPPAAYDLGPAAPRVWAINGNRTISDHGDVINESTAWALFNLARS